MVKKKTQKKTTKRKVSKALTPYEVMDRYDEVQIVNDIDGRIPKAAEKMVYSFPDKQTGQEVVGLSWAGSKEAEREFNRRKLTQITITDKALISQGNGFVDILVYAYDSKRKIGKWGASRGYDKMRLRDGSIVDDKFPSAKAMSKAQRNAINNLLPAEKVAKMIQSWIKQKKVEYIEAPKAETPKTQQPQSDWLSKLKIELYKMGAKDEQGALALLRKQTGLMIKDFKITPKNAQIAYMMLLNQTSK